MKKLILLLFIYSFSYPLTATKLKGGMNQNQLVYSCVKSENFTVKFEKGQKEALCDCVIGRYYTRVKKAPDLTDANKLDNFQFVQKYFETKKGDVINDKYDAIGAIFEDMDHCIKELKLPFPTMKSEKKKSKSKKE